MGRSLLPRASEWPGGQRQPGEVWLGFWCSEGLLSLWTLSERKLGEGMALLVSEQVI